MDNPGIMYVALERQVLRPMNLSLKFRTGEQDDDEEVDIESSKWVQRGLCIDLRQGREACARSWVFVH